MLRPEVEDKYLVGTTPPISFLPYLVFASFLVSLIGTFTTVELLHRRASGTGWRPWADIAICSVTFGLVAVWCMHFVGNRAIILGDGELEIQLYYDETYVVLSAILPIIPIFMGLSVAIRFHELGRRAIVRYGSLAVCGLCTGGATTMVHFLGNIGVENCRMSANWANMVGSAAVAVVICSVGFGLFFYWGKLWMNNIWRRICVSFTLAVGICGMHWTAATGTWYQIEAYHDGEEADQNVNLIVAYCLLTISCIACVILGFIKQRQRKEEKSRAQQAVLALATFDPSGKLLVNKTGLMPCQTIIQHFNQGAFDDELDTSHPVFQWIFRVTRNWNGISDLIPSMREHLQLAGYLEATSPGNKRRNSLHESDDATSSATFRKLFCVTADEMATALEMGLEKLGCLYEDVLTTGTMTTNRGTWTGTHTTKTTPDVNVTINDLESGRFEPVVFGKGQMLILSRKVDASEAHRLQQLGYSFAEIEQVSHNIARSLQIPCGDLEDLIIRLHAFSDRQYSVPKSGTYLASFLVQPRPGMKSMDVVVPRANSGRLPMVKLDDDQLDSHQLEILSTFDGLTLDRCLARIKASSEPDTKVSAFMHKFGSQIESLLRECPEEALHFSTFSAQQLDMVNGQTDFSQAKVFAFCGIKEIYVQSLQSFTLKAIPFSFFKTYLRSQTGCADHAVLVQRNHDEFGYLQRAQSDAETSSSSLSSKWPWSLRKEKSLSSERSWNEETDSVDNLVNHRLHTRTLTAASGHSMWGRMVTNSLEEIKSPRSKSSFKVEMHSMKRAKNNMVDQESQTLADLLMTITTASRGSLMSRPPTSVEPGANHSFA
ncbi:hypothetical protein COCCADRAFT_2977 [Bipolaris zeicola 26-R-13]|uniref:MHYT domain-containing protein n=1 Tax=Cochliobolus carbonum (strain 26-R-13) TaxID=930089 RepID=W6YDS7_COCC2|nr:uncharacterized protein COCCADRAFT_2977 [Bipolaris zeicola 26-R-13]EUC35818.1 hypothetical protein COCCADRAFT_2977 [Bipolaris zeicola 26-R-13]